MSVKKREKILIVEDDAMIAMDFGDAFVSAGFDVLGPAATVDAAMSLIETEMPFLASLDYNIGKVTSAPVAWRLHGYGARFVFVTGCAHDILKRDNLPNVPVLRKPVDPSSVLHSLIVGKTTMLKHSHGHRIAKVA